MLLINLVENMHFFVAEISQMDVPSLNGSTRRAQETLDENLSAYIKIVFRRPFGKIIVSDWQPPLSSHLLILLLFQDFFEGIDRVTKDLNSGDITSNSNFTKASLRKVLKDYNSKDIRKYIDVLSKRVEKHFTDGEKVDESNSAISGKVLLDVWKVCEEEFVKLTETWTSRITQWYSDSGITLEFTRTDVEAAFRRQKFGL